MEFKDGMTEWSEGFYLLVWNETSPQETVEENAGILKEMGLNVEYEMGDNVVEFDMSCRNEQLFKDALTIVMGLRGEYLGDISLMVLDGNEVRSPIWEEIDLYVMEPVFEREVESRPVAAQKDRFSFDSIDLEIQDGLPPEIGGNFDRAIDLLESYKREYYETGEELGYGREIIDQLWAKMMNDFNDQVAVFR